MKKISLKLTALAIVFIVMLALASCNGDALPSPSASAVTNEGWAPSSTLPAVTEDTPILDSETGSFVQQPSARDYSYMWWKSGFNNPAGGGQLNIQTGYYGMAVNPSQGQITKLDSINELVTQTEAGTEDNSRIDGMSAVSMDYNVAIDGETYEFSFVKKPDDNSSAYSRILETGRYMQRIDIMHLRYSQLSDVLGRLEIAALPEYFSLEYSIFSDYEIANADLEFSMALSEEYVHSETSGDNKVMTFFKDNGSGITFVMPNRDGWSIRAEGNTVYFRAESLAVPKSEYTGFNVIVIPATQASLSNADIYYGSEQASVSAVQIEPREGREQDVEFDPKGYVAISLNRMFSASGASFVSSSNRNALDRLKFTIENPTDENIRVPLQFYKDAPFAVQGCSPFLRDAETGEPIGVQVQLTKNWHDNAAIAEDDPLKFWSGIWFHGYTIIEVPANSSVTYEFTMTYANWGGVYASSHAQISLAGWGGNYQQWETSSIGAFSEAFCYDPETAHGRAFIDDIRPLNVDSMGGKYGWTSCNGGGNFLYYNVNYNASMMMFQQVRTQFKKQGPNLTEVIYTGVTRDGKVKFEITANLPRTDDMARVYHTFKYTFLEDVTFDRMAFYQFGADDYNDNVWMTMAVGNDDGPASFTIDGETFSGEFALPLSDTERYYGSEDVMQRIDIGGEGLWFAYMGAQRQEHKSGPDSNRALNVISYNAVLNGETYTKPSFNIRCTTNYNIQCNLIELCPPAAVGNTIEKGSTVEGVVEYLNLPVSKEAYYGPSEVMQSIPEEYFNTYRAAYYYVLGGKYITEASIGEITKAVPITVKTVEGDVAAQITITGGISYVPITFTNVPSYSGYRLEKKEGEQWVMVDQSYNGNDYWQAWYDSDTATYELTFNVEHSGDPEAVYEYRLVKQQS